MNQKYWDAKKLRITLATTLESVNKLISLQSLEQKGQDVEEEKVTTCLKIYVNIIDLKRSMIPFTPSF